MSQIIFLTSRVSNGFLNDNKASDLDLSMKPLDSFCLVFRVESHLL